MPLNADWRCSECGHCLPFGHGDVFFYRTIRGVMVYQRKCPKCHGVMLKEDRVSGEAH